MNITKSFRVESLSKDDLILWFRKNVSNRLHTIEELGTGGDFLLAMEMLIPGSVATQKVKCEKTTESERIRNFQTLRKMFHKLGIDKDIEAERMVRGLFKENYHFALWFRAFFVANYKGVVRSPLDPLHPLRHLKRMKTGLISEDPAENGVTAGSSKEDLPNINQNCKINNSVLTNPKDPENEYGGSVTTRILKKDTPPESNPLRVDVRRVYTVKNTSKQDLIRWFRSTLSPNLHSIEELGTGADFCVGVEVLFPGSIPMHQVRFSKTSESERVANFRVFGRALDDLGVEKEIVTERLAKGIFKDNFQFAQWFKSFFMSNYRGQSYDIGEMRAAKRKKLKSRIEFPNDQTSRTLTKEIPSENLGQGDAVARGALGHKGKLGLPEVGNTSDLCKIVQMEMVDAASQTDQPLPSMCRRMMSSATDSENQDKLLRIRFACDEWSANELSKTIIRLLDGEDNLNDDDEDDDDDDEEDEEEEEQGEEEAYEVTEGSEERGEEEKKKIRPYGGQLLPAL